MAQRTPNAHGMTRLLRHNRPVARDITLKKKARYRHVHSEEVWEEFLTYMTNEHGPVARTWAYWQGTDPLDEAGSILATFMNWMMFFRQVQHARPLFARLLCFCFLLMPAHLLLSFVCQGRHGPVELCAIGRDVVDADSRENYVPTAEHTGNKGTAKALAQCDLQGVGVLRRLGRTLEGLLWLEVLRSDFRHSGPEARCSASLPTC
jgi:hypothetical protein